MKHSIAVQVSKPRVFLSVNGFVFSPSTETKVGMVVLWEPGSFKKIIVKLAFST